MTNTETPTNEPNKTAAHPASEPRDVCSNEYPPQTVKTPEGISYTYSGDSSEITKLDDPVRKAKCVISKDFTLNPVSIDDKYYSHIYYLDNRQIDCHLVNIELKEDDKVLASMWVCYDKIESRFGLFHQIEPELKKYIVSDKERDQIKIDFIRFIPVVKECFARAKAGLSFESDIQEHEFLDALFESRIDKVKGIVYSLKYNVLADFVISTFHPVNFMGMLYIYDSTSHLYTRGESRTRARIAELIGLLSGKAASIKFDILQKTAKIGGDIDEIYNLVFLSNVIPGNKSPFNTYYGIPVENGVLKIVEDGEELDYIFEPYRPDMLFTWKIVTPYVEGADVEKALDILKQWSPDEYGILIQIPAQAIAQSLPDISPFKTGYTIIGEKNSGKTSYAELVIKTIGEENISTIAPQDLGNQFVNSIMEGKLMNFKDELSDVSIKNAEAYKAHTSTLYFTIEGKYQKAYTGKIPAVMISAGNRTPDLEHKVFNDDSFMEKNQIIPFTEQFEQDSTWDTKHINLDVLIGYFVLIIAMVLEILKTGKLPHKDDVDTTRSLWAQWNGQKHPVNVFLRLHIERDPAGQIYKDDFRKALQNFVETYDGDEQTKMSFIEKMPKSDKALTMYLKSRGIITGRESTGERKFTFAGIRWKQDSKYNPMFEDVRNWMET